MIFDFEQKSALFWKMERTRRELRAAIYAVYKEYHWKKERTHSHIRMTLTCTEYKSKVVINMTEKNEYYEAIRKQYPETISKDQFYRIAHISKATALYLLQSGLVPCKDTGKKTRRYTIRTEDVIFYMIDREEHPEIFAAPENWYRGRSGRYTPCKAVEKKLDKLSGRDRKALQKYLETVLEQYNDLMTVPEVIEVIGYSDTSIHRWCHNKKLKAFKPSGSFRIPKISLIEFLISQESFDIKRKSWKHILLLENFVDQNKI